MTKPTELDLHDFDKYTNCTFIHGCYIPDRICNDLVDYFEKSPHRHVSGKILNDVDNLTVDDSKKKSTDIGFDVLQDEEDNRLLSEYLAYLNLCIKEYEYKYDRAGLMASYGITEGPPGAGDNRKFNPKNPPDGVINSRDIFQHMYQTAEEALAASKWLGCKGNVHFHDDEAVWMPCVME